MTKLKLIDTELIEAKKQLCKCPKCGNMHETKIPWVGNGIPRKYCVICKGNNREIPVITITKSRKKLPSQS